MSKPAPSLVEVIDLALREKLPLKIDWDKLHERAVAAAIAEHILLWSDLEVRPRRRVTKPDADLVELINFVLRNKLPRVVKWIDEPESEVVAYSVAEHVQNMFDLKRRAPAKRRRGTAASP
jgi:hypothetical protein